MKRKKNRHPTRKKGMSCLLILAMLFGVWTNVSAAESVESVAEGAAPVAEGTAPAHRKYIRYNGGDSYTLTLDVTGKYDSELSTPKLDVVLVIDCSGSMDDRMGWQDSRKRIDVLKEVVTQAGGLSDAILNNSQIDAQMAVVSYSGQSDYRYDWYSGKYVRIENSSAWDDAEWLNGGTWSDAKETVDFVVNGIEADGGTNCQAGIRCGKEALAGAREDARKVMIFLSDGEPTFRYDEEGYTQGTGNSDTDKANANAAYGEAENLAGLDRFYTIGFTEGADNTFLGTLAESAAALTESKSYSAADADALSEAFQQIVGNLTEYTCRGVTITDTLSDYAELPDAENLNAQVRAYRADGSEADLSGVNVRVEYDAQTRQVTAVFPADYVLEQDVTYSVSFDVKPTQKAYDAFADMGGYGGITGSAGSDAPGNDTSSGHPGFYTNGDAQLTYTFGKEGAEPAVVPYAQYPVLQVDALTIPVEKVWKNTAESEKQEITAYLYQDTETTPYREVKLNAANGWKNQFSGVAKGHGYRVEELKPEGFDSLITGSVEVGFVITNTKKPSLTITKEVTGEMGDRTKAFLFTIKLEDESGAPVCGSFAYKGGVLSNAEDVTKPEDGTKSGKATKPEDGTLVFEKGQAQIRLSHGQTIEIQNLPAGTRYTAEESAKDAEGYEVSWNGKAGARVEGVLNGNVTANAVNCREAVPITGTSVGTVILPGILTGLAVVIVFAVISLILRHRRHDE